MGLLTNYWTGPDRSTRAAESAIGNLEPTVAMWSLDELVTGQTDAAEQWDGQADFDVDTEAGLYQLRPGLVAALAGLSDEEAGRIAAEWAKSEEVTPGDPSELPRVRTEMHRVLGELGRLSRLATERDWSVYCSWSL